MVGFLEELDFRLWSRGISVKTSDVPGASEMMPGCAGWM